MKNFDPARQRPIWSVLVLLLPLANAGYGSAPTPVVEEHPPPPSRISLTALYDERLETIRLNLASQQLSDQIKHLSGNRERVWSEIERMQPEFKRIESEIERVESGIAQKAKQAVIEDSDLQFAEHSLQAVRRVLSSTLPVLISSANAMDSWVGSSIDTVMESMGAPDSTTPRIDDGKVYLWLQTCGLGINARRSFTTDRAGKVVDWYMKQCP
ncbi:MAG: hypothetical protein GDA55_06430 [Cellvibrionales bacterium]|nr:hypothetical protein [Cellvibrionales bacterium]